MTWSKVTEHYINTEYCCVKPNEEQWGVVGGGEKLVNVRWSAKTDERMSPATGARVYACVYMCESA